MVRLRYTIKANVITFIVNEYVNRPRDPWTGKLYNPKVPVDFKVWLIHRSNGRCENVRCGKSFTATGSTVFNVHHDCSDGTLKAFCAGCNTRARRKYEYIQQEDQDK